MIRRAMLTALTDIVAEETSAIQRARIAERFELACEAELEISREAIEFENAIEHVLKQATESANELTWQ
jgi:hypothetical protein